MTIRIFKNCGENIETINRVTHVLTHSAATGNDGLDLEIQVVELNDTITTKQVHLEKWDFYGIDI